jgi:urease accessory protein
MLEVRQLASMGSPVELLELPFEQRQRSRLKATLLSGSEVAILLPRGTVLRHGTLLRASSGQVIEVRAAPEDVSTVRTTEAVQLARLAYHLGNRHIRLEVGRDYLRYQHDPVLDDMVRQLGAEVTRESMPFEPEAGAYDQGNGRHVAN